MLSHKKDKNLFLSVTIQMLYYYLKKVTFFDRFNGFLFI